VRGGTATARGQVVVRALVAALTVWLCAAPAAGQDAGPGRVMPDRGAEHVANGTRVTYQEHPPTSGPHWPEWARWGIHPITVSEEAFVHNLEHGGVVILYRCPDPCPDVERQLEATFRALPPSKYGHVKVVISPNDRIRARFALLAWRRLDEFERFDRDRIMRLVRGCQDKGPEDVP